MLLLPSGFEKTAMTGQIPKDITDGIIGSIPIGAVC